MVSLRNLARRFFIFLNGLAGLLFLLSCCNAFLHPEKWWFISLLAFFFPLFLILLIVFFIIWLILRSRLVFISLSCLLIGWSNIHAFFAWSTASHDFNRKDSSSLRILTWNVRLWDEFAIKKKDTPGHLAPMLSLVEKQQADILCFQEFYEPTDSTRSNIYYISRQLGYPYYLFSKDHNSAKKYATGVILFSKFPIIAAYQTHFNMDSALKPESLISADIDVRGRTIRVFTTHLQSVLFKPKDFRSVEIIRNAQDSMLEASRSLALKLRTALTLRGRQADAVRREIDKSPGPSIICGDFNDVPNSYTYFHIRGERQDAFIEKSFGVGRTYIHIAPTLRIDYILPSEDFEVLQTMKITSPFSDHHAVVTDLMLQDRKR